MSSNGLIYWFGGAATAVVGSWISSKSRVYHDARGKHHQELKQRVLEPIRDLLEHTYRALFDDPTLGANATPDEHHYDKTALATQDPVAAAVSLSFHDPARFTGCSLLEQCPIAARSGRVPTISSRGPSRRLSQSPSFCSQPAPILFLHGFFLIAASI